MKLELDINGGRVVVDLPPQTRLLDVLRRELRLVGTKEGCGEGECGACTVLLDGAAVNACLIPVAQAVGHQVQTIEALAGAANAGGPRLTDVQAALLEHGGAQCGICTPGVALAATAALASNPGANPMRLRELMAGNLCRCTGYQAIIDALLEVAKTNREHPS